MDIIYSTSDYCTIKEEKENFCPNEWSSVQYNIYFKV